MLGFRDACFKDWVIEIGLFGHSWASFGFPDFFRAPVSWPWAVGRITVRHEPEGELSSIISVDSGCNFFAA